MRQKDSNSKWRNERSPEHGRRRYKAMPSICKRSEDLHPGLCETRYREVSNEEGGWDVNAVLIKVKRQELWSNGRDLLLLRIPKKKKRLKMVI